MSTIREIIWNEIDEINKEKENLDPVLCSEKLVILSTYYANLNKHLADLQDKFYKFHAMTMDANPEMSAAKLNIIVKAGDEYQRMNEAEKLDRSLLQVIRSMNKYIKAKAGEFESSRHL